MNVSCGIEAPRPGGLWRELLVARELPRLVLAAPALARAPRGGGRPVLTLPGYGAGERALAPLRAFLRWLGYEARPWGLGRNRGDVQRLVPRVVGIVERFAAEVGRPVSLVGWSLGGVLAREAARERPAAVARVVTLGTPIVGGPRYTVLAGRYRRRGFDLDAISQAVEERNAIPIPCPVTAIYSRRDPIVAWQACIDRFSPRAENVEVRSSHFGLTLDPAVLDVVAGALGRGEAVADGAGEPAMRG